MHAEKKEKHFYYVIHTQAIDWAYLEFDRFSRYWDSKISGARILLARVKIHCSVSVVVYRSIYLTPETLPCLLITNLNSASLAQVSTTALFADTAILRALLNAAFCAKLFCLKFRFIMLQCERYCIISKLCQQSTSFFEWSIVYFGQI